MSIDGFLFSHYLFFMALRVSRLLHAGYLLECNGTTIAFDPIFETPFSQNCYAFPEVHFDHAALAQLKWDAVLISHDHDDHFSLESLKWIDRDTPIYIFTFFKELLGLLTELGFKKVYQIELLRPLHIGPFEIMALEALESDVDSIYHIRAEGLNILNVVDSWIGPSTFEKLLNVKRWDLILWPFQTMRELEVIAPSLAEPLSPATTQLPPEWCEQIQQLNPRVIVPSSCQFQFEEWSWHNQAFFPISYAQFEKQMVQTIPQAKTQRLDPGQSLKLTSDGYQMGPRLTWITAVDGPRRDYEFNPEIKPQPVSEIAQHFKTLSPSKKKELEKFFQMQLEAQFQKLACRQDSFFSTLRYWKLITYDSQGVATFYRYQILHNKIQKEVLQGPHDWLTEISEAKLFSALKEGESLTSIYIRVTPQQPADPLEDPLLRCLYEGKIGNYQKAQLRNLKIEISDQLKTEM